MGLAGGSTRKPQGWAADLRFRQKASLLRIPGTADFCEDLLGNDEQVAMFGMAQHDSGPHKVLLHG